MPTPSPKKLSLPRIGRIRLEHFDIYTRQPTVEVAVEKPVFCLIGANGLGKSTFLNTVNFVATGAIPDPLRTFQSAADYYKNASRPNRAEEYFTGRISENLRGLARATIELTWPNKAIEITRDIFPEGAISELSIKDLTKGTSRKLSVLDDETVDLGADYERFIKDCTGLEDFAQFVFLFHFVCTFDEGRHLLMWDASALTNVLYLAFGADPGAAMQADKLQRDMDRESSRGRNVRFSARHVSDRMKQLQELVQGEQSSDHETERDLKLQFEALLEDHKSAEERVRVKQIDLRDADLKWAELSSSLTEAQIEYRRTFSSRLRKSSSVEHHPIVRSSVAENRCAVCGTSGVGIKIEERVKAHQCPLCCTGITDEKDDGAGIAKLREIDGNIIRIREQLTTILKTRERLSGELDSAQAAERTAQAALKAFEGKRGSDLIRFSSGQSFSALKKEIAKLETERAEFIKQSEEHYKKRDEVRERLRVLERQLKRQYDAGSEQFVPRFRELAEEFIGLPIDVELDHKQGANDSGFGLKLRMNASLRLSPDKMSESQRFFIDIALRMALAEHMSETPAVLLIDTPEGSLDIAYEARAGAMLSKFVAAGNAVVMTANLRSSQLVLRLAELQRRGGMQIVRMTDWTDLTQVQQSEEKLFVEAYDAIDAALN